MNDHDDPNPENEDSREQTLLRFGSEPFELVNKPKVCKKEYHTFGSYLTKHHTTAGQKLEDAILPLQQTPSKF